jgi:hypothetical protein
MGSVWASTFRRAIFFFVAVSLISSGLAGCIIPEAAPLLGHERKKRILYDVIRGVQCEISQSVRDQIDRDRAGEWGTRKLEWLETWNALIDLRLTIDDSVSFNPGVSFLTPNWLNANVWLANGTRRSVPQNYSFGVGGGVAYEPSREDMVQFAYPFQMFVNERRELVEATADKPCYTIAGITIQGDLKLGDWLDDVLEPVKKCAFLGLPADTNQIGPLSMFSGEAEQSEVCRRANFKDKLLVNPISTITHQVQFVLRFDVNATPTWSLVRVAAGARPGSPGLFDINRKDTSTLLITLGPPAGGKNVVKEILWPKKRVAKGAQPPISSFLPFLSPVMIFTHQASEIRAFGLGP